MLAFNPASGSFCPKALARLVRAFESEGHSVVLANSREVDLAAGQAVDLVCAYGGDGTIRTIVNGGLNRAGNGQVDGLAGRLFCVFPSGTINLLARELGYCAQPLRFVRSLGQRAARRVHFAQAGGEALLCCASVGPDALAVAQVSGALKARIGRLAYLVAALGLLWRWPRRRFAFVLDGEPLTGEALFVLNGRYYAGPWVMDEAAALGVDGLQAVVLPRAGRRDLLQLALAAMIHPALGSARWQRRAVREVAMAAGADQGESAGWPVPVPVPVPVQVPVQVDGDIVAQCPVQISMAQQVLYFA